jgi:hypothetical protein
MTIASVLSRRRRVLLLCMMSVLLHCLMISWVAAGIGAAPDVPPTPAPATTIVAQLRTAPAAVALAEPVQPVAVPAPARARAPRPRVALAPAPVGQAASADLLSLPVAPEDSAPPVSETLALASVAELVPAVQAEALPPLLRASLPPSSVLSLDVARTDANGRAWGGSGAISWTRKGDSYTMSVEAGLNMIVTRLNLLVMTSEGRVGERGFEPQRATEKRSGRSETAVHFDREQNKITFSAIAASVQLAPGAQDRATLPMQLAAIARADPAQFDAPFEVLVGESRGASVYRFEPVGEEEIDTKLGRLKTLHLTRPPRPGAYNARLDVWLAPAHGWYPVRIRNTEASGAVTTQTVNKIVVTDTGL